MVCYPRAVWRNACQAEKIASILLLAGLLAVAGCGYQLVGRGSIRGGARTVALRGFSNETKEPGVEAIVTDALYREFARRGDLRIVRDASRADLVVSGAVATAFVSARSFSSVQLTVEYQVSLRLAVKVQPRDGKALVLDPRSLRESDRFLASADVEVSRKNREEAFRRLAGILAARVRDALYVQVAP